MNDRVAITAPNDASRRDMLLAYLQRAVDYLDKDHLPRSNLKTAGEGLGLTSELQLSPVAVVREAKNRPGRHHRTRHGATSSANASVRLAASQPA